MPLLSFEFTFQQHMRIAKGEGTRVPFHEDGICAVYTALLCYHFLMTNKNVAHSYGLLCASRARHHPDFAGYISPERQLPSRNPLSAIGSSQQEQFASPNSPGAFNPLQLLFGSVVSHPAPTESPVATGIQRRSESMLPSSGSSAAPPSPSDAFLNRMAACPMYGEDFNINNNNVLREAVDLCYGSGNSSSRPQRRLFGLFEIFRRHSYIEENPQTFNVGMDSFNLCNFQEFHQSWLGALPELIAMITLLVRVPQYDCMYLGVYPSGASNGHALAILKQGRFLRLFDSNNGITYETDQIASIIETINFLYPIHGFGLMGNVRFLGTFSPSPLLSLQPLSSDSHSAAHASARRCALCGHNISRNTSLNLVVNGCRSESSVSTRLECCCSCLPISLPQGVVEVMHSTMQIP